MVYINIQGVHIQVIRQRLNLQQYKNEPEVIICDECDAPCSVYSVVLGGGRVFCSDKCMEDNC